MRRCRWVNLDNPKYVSYHDNEWGRRLDDDRKLFEMLILEGFQAGLSWECVLNKRDNFYNACDNFDYNVIANYDEDKIEKLLNDKGIIRSRRKIEAMINNAKVFIKIREEWGSFSNYIWHFTNNKTIKNHNDEFVVSNELSDMVSKDLKQKGMKYVGEVIIYSYLEAIGVLDNHEIKCYRY